MTDPSLAPDEALLRRFLLGELSGQELEFVAAYLERHPEAASAFPTLKVDDLLLVALRRREPTDDSPAVAELITRLSRMSAIRPDAPTANDINPAATTPTDQPHLATPVVDPAELEESARAMLAKSERPSDLGRLGRYRVLRVLGRGGMGVVFEAEDDTLKRRVALKAMRADIASGAAARKRFVREAESAAKVEHDNIVPIYDIVEAGAVPFIAMPLLIGESLENRLKSPVPLNISDALTIGRQVALGLAAAHAAGLIHRDIKPGNIWLEQTPLGAFRRARILDFGLAREVRDTGLTASGAIMGTPAYMAPEQARGEKVDHRADLFSLGCVLYQMATGRRPFSGDTALAVLSALANETPPPPQQVNPAVPAALSALIELLLRKNPAERWPTTAHEVADELFRIATDPPSTSGVRPGLPPPAAPRPVPRADEVWAGAAVGETEEVPPATPPRRPRRRAFVTLAVLAAVLALAGYFGETLTRLVTDKGELVVEVDDPDIEVKVVRGDAVLVDRTKRRAFVIEAGDGEVIFFDPTIGAEALAEPFQLKRGDKTTVRTTMAQVAAARSKQPEPAAPRGPLPPGPPKLAPLPHEPAKNDTALVPKEPKPAVEEQREALRAACRLGAKVVINNQHITDPEKIPAGPYLKDYFLSFEKRPRITSETVEALRHLPRGLTMLSLGVIDKPGAEFLTDDVLAKLVSFRAFRDLRNLTLANTAVTDAGLEHLKACPGLESLSLAGSKITGKGLPHLPDKLQQLDLTGCPLTHEGFASVTARGGIEHLTLIDVKTAEDLLATVGELKNVRTLFLNNTKLSVAALARLKQLPRLQQLSLSGVELTDEGLATVAALPGLRILTVSGTRISEAGWENVAALKKLNTLHINQARTLGDDELAHFKSLPQLSQLNLNDARRITDDGLVHLAACAKLELLTVYNSQVTEEGAKKLAKSLPKCEIDWGIGKIVPRK